MEREAQKAAAAAFKKHAKETGSNRKRDTFTPLEYMLDIMNNPAQPASRRLEAARAAAPYVHRKMPQEVLLPRNANGGGIIMVPDDADEASWAAAAKEQQDKLLTSEKSMVH